MLIWQIKIFFNSAIWVSKITEFYADFKSVEKVAKNSCEKVSNKKVTKNWDFDFYYCELSFWPITSFGWFFALFLMDSNLASNYSFYDTHIKFLKKKNCLLLILPLFLTFKPKSDKMVKKKKKIFFKNLS